MLKWSIERYPAPFIMATVIALVILAGILIAGSATLVPTALLFVPRSSMVI